jgi:hypothetical protein
MRAMDAMHAMRGMRICVQSHIRSVQELLRWLRPLQNGFHA